LQPLYRIHHLVPGFIFFDDPIHQPIHFAPILRTNVCGVVAHVFEVLVLLEHRRFVDVIVRRQAIGVGIFGQQADVFQIVATDVDVKKHHVTVHILLAHHVFEVSLRRNERLGQARLLIPRIQCKVDYCDSRIAEPIRNFRAKQPAIRSNVDPETFLGRVVNNFVRYVRTQQRFTAHQSQNATSMIVQPVDRPFGNIFGHAFHFVVESPAIPAIQIALVIEKQIRRDGMKLSRLHTGANVWKQPTTR